MLARNRIRLTAVASIDDVTVPFGPSCDDLGPVAVDCDGGNVLAFDSPNRSFLNQLTFDDEASSSLPFIGVYSEVNSYQFKAMDYDATDTGITLVVAIYVTANSDWQAEADLDKIEERVLFRLMRPDPVLTPIGMLPPLRSYRDLQISTGTEREDDGDRRIFGREIRLTMTGCDNLAPPDCCINECCSVINAAAK